MSQLLLALARRERLLRSPQSEDPSARTSFGDEALTLEKVRRTGGDGRSSPAVSWDRLLALAWRWGQKPEGWWRKRGNSDSCTHSNGGGGVEDEERVDEAAKRTAGYGLVRRKLLRSEKGRWPFHLLHVRGAKETPASPLQSFRALLFLTVCLRLSCVASSSSFSCKEESLMFLHRNERLWSGHFWRLEKVVSVFIPKWHSLPAPLEGSKFLDFSVLCFKIMNTCCYQPPHLMAAFL